MKRKHKREGFGRGLGKAMVQLERAGDKNAELMFGTKKPKEKDLIKGYL
jgi:hypothetical protein